MFQRVEQFFELQPNAFQQPSSIVADEFPIAAVLEKHLGSEFVSALGDDDADHAVGVSHLLSQ